jgi:hypothetical protein
MSFNNIEFEDNKVWHDFHWNTMQYNIDIEIKEKHTINYYDLRLAYSNYKYSYVDPVVIKNVNYVSNNMIYQDGTFVALRYDPNTLTITLDDELSGVFNSKKLTLPESATEVFLFVEENKPIDSDITYKISTDSRKSWIDINPREPVSVNNAHVLELKADFSKTLEADPPRLINYCLMWK